MTKIRLVPVREDGSIPPIPDNAIGLVRWFRNQSSQGMLFDDENRVAAIPKDPDVWAIEWIYA